MSDLVSAIKQICEEKGLSYEAVVGTIESALAAAYRKDFGEKNQNIRVEFNPETAKSKVFDVKTVVEDMPPEEKEEDGGEEKSEESALKQINREEKPVEKPDINTWEMKIYGRDIYDNIRNNTKTIETRAGKEEGADKDWKQFKEGDVINFSLVSENKEAVIETGELGKKIERIHHFKTVDDMLAALDPEKIAPGSTAEQFKKQLMKYPGYKERLKQYGVWAFELVDKDRRFNPKTEIQLSDAKLLKKTAKIGDEIRTKLEVPDEYGRMAAQTAKQVIIQRLREAERNMVFEEFKDKEHEVVSGVVQRREGRIILIDLGKGVGILPIDEQIMGERYNPGNRIKVYVKEVTMGSKGPEIILSRTSNEILKKVFYLEIPEISNGLIELKAVAREAGSRSKVAVWTDSDNVDPIGSCVGQRGARIQTIISELGGEKVDIIEYADESEKFIANALSPAKILHINLNEDTRRAIVTVASDQLSLAIGKGGQNARLAARLTGWKIDIVEDKAKADDSETKKGEAEKDKKDKNDEKKKDKTKTDKTDKQDDQAGKKTEEQKDKKEEKTDEEKKSTTENEKEKDDNGADKDKKEKKDQKSP